MTERNDGAGRGERRFEEILAELERAVRELEGDDLPLEAALARFEAGVALAREGAARLDAAERRVEEILADGAIAPLPPVDETT